MSNERQIRNLIESWVHAINHGDLAGVTDRHTDDIVMFDVPPPENGVRGIDAYRATWPAFFAWIRSGARFEIEELDVVAGDDTAFALALLWCGTDSDLAHTPQRRLRLTLGLVRANDQWQVCHEHHSFTHDGSADAENAVRAIHQRWFDATAARDVDGIMESLADDVVSYEHITPLEYRGANAVRQVCQAGLDASPADVTFEMPEISVVADGDLAVAWGLNHVSTTNADGTPVDDWSRATRVFQRRNGDWQMIHQHNSYPVES